MSSDGWWDEAIIDPGNDAGDYTDEGEPKGLLHTTEGKSYAGARQAYVLNNSWPHATATFESGIFVCYQHNSLLVAARSLRNLSGGVQTNRDRVAQLEIVGTANRHNAASWGTQYVENFPRAFLDGIARWMRFCNKTLGIPNRCAVIFKAYPESYGANGVRFTGPEFDAYSGWLGHQHAPENDHGDPGLIDMAYLLAEAAGPASIPEPEEGDDMPFIVTNPRGQSLLVASDLSRANTMSATSKKAYLDGGIKEARPIPEDEFDRYERLPRLA